MAKWQSRYYKVIDMIVNKNWKIFKYNINL